MSKFFQDTEGFWYPIKHIECIHPVNEQDMWRVEMRGDRNHVYIYHEAYAFLTGDEL